MLKQNQSLLRFNLVFLDIISLALAYLIAYYFKFRPASLAQVESRYFLVFALSIPVILLTYYFTDVYGGYRLGRVRKEVFILLRANLVAMGIVFGLMYLTKAYIFSRIVISTYALLATLFTIGQRILVVSYIKYLHRKGLNLKKILIVGAGNLGQKFAGKILANRNYGYDLVGFLDDSPKKLGKKYFGVRVLGEVGQLEETLTANEIEEVVVALPLKAYQKFNGIVEACEKHGIRMVIIPDFYDYLPGRPLVEDFDDIPVLNVRYVPLDLPFNRVLKRTFDVLFSLLAIFITAPILIFVAVGVKFTSSGPIFFKQERVGLNNKPFNMLKFRSMKFSDEQTAQTVWTTADDPRKTKFGSFIRKTSLDELPQFFNVLLGDMSIIGPRPERPFFVEKFKEEIPKYMVKHQVKPGITGWAQVNGWRGDTSIKKRIECDIYYIENWDLLLDIKILVMTVFKGFINKHAY